MLMDWRGGREAGLVRQITGIGYQDFEEIRDGGIFYIDKTDFIREWWEYADKVTLIARPRRFGKTLNMSMLEKFFSVRFAGRRDLFEGLEIWKQEKYRKLQGTYPVISLSFANVKERTYKGAFWRISQIISELYSNNRFLLDGDLLSKEEKNYARSVSADMPEAAAAAAIHQLSKFLHDYYGKKVLIFLDEYDTPMQEAYVNEYWDELASFIRNMFNAAFKANPYLERAVMTGVTRIGKESIFSDLNNLEVVTATSEKYGDSFGFTEGEVFAALEAYGFADRKKEVKKWYDGFTFGGKKDIYNPWSIINYLDKGKLGAYWANTSSNSLVGKLIQEGSKEIKIEMERLLSGKTLVAEIDEQLAYSQLSTKQNAIWSLLLASGYLKVVGYEGYGEDADEHFMPAEPKYELALTNLEVKIMFRVMIRDWFARSEDAYNDFVKALLLGDLDAMNLYMNKVALSMFSYFDTGKNPGDGDPERFYHGFVLGLMAELSGRYVLTSNRESGFGRYDVMLEPRRAEDDGIIMEFKVFQSKREKGLEDTAEAALKQIEEKKYESLLIEKGIPRERIRKYGFAFRGKEILIGGGR